MSLNGLDAPAIAQAAETVRAESKAWFLLKYATRDEIELYAKGSAGVTEAAASISSYEDKSPLYGVVTHDGKRALIRYLPAGTSRLLQARVKVHLDAISSHFPHNTELYITTAEELTAEALASASPVLAAASPVSTSVDNTLTSPLSSTILGRLPSNAGSSSARSGHGSSSNGDTVVKEEDGSPDTPSSRAARLLADVRAGKLESHEVLAALKITPTRDSDRRPSDNSLERPERSIGSPRADDAHRTTSISSLDPQSAKFSSPRPSISSSSDLYRSKVKVGPRPVQSTESSAATNVASLPAGVSLPKPVSPPPAQPQAQRAPSQKSPSPESTHFSNMPFGAGGSIVPIVQAPASVVSAAGRSTAASIMTMPPNLGTRKGSEASLAVQGDQQATEKARLMRALEMQRKKQARRGGDDLPSAEPSPSLPSEANGAVNGSQGYSSRTSNVGRQPGAHTAGGFDPPDLDTATASRLHAATKSSPTLGSMMNFPLIAPEDVKVPGSAAAVATASREGFGSQQSKQPEQSNASEPTTRLPDLSASGPATLKIDTIQPGSPGGGQYSQSKETNSSPKSHSPASDGTARGQDSTITPVKVQTNTLKKIPAPIDTSLVPDTGKEESQLTPVAVQPDSEKIPPADTLPLSEREEANSKIGQHHSSHISISSSILGASDFMDELEATDVQEAQPMTMLRSPMAPNFPRTFAHPETKLDTVEGNSTPAETEKSLATDDAQEKKIQAEKEVFQPLAVVESIEPTKAATSVSNLKDEAVPPSSVLAAPATELSTAAPKLANEPKAPTEETSVAPVADAVNANKSAETKTIHEETPMLTSEATKGPVPIVEQAVKQETQSVSSAAQTTVAEKPITKSSAPIGNNQVVDPMKAIIEAEMNDSAPVAAESQTQSAETAQPLQSFSVPTEPKQSSPDTVQTPAEEAVDPLSISKTGTQGSLKKHPTVQPPHIWGGALRSASNPTGGEPPRHLSPVPDLSRMTRSASAASNASAMNRPDSPSSVKKVSMGSRIADRIKALEKSSGSGSTSSAPVYAASSVSVSSRKSSYNTPPGSSGTGKLSTSSPNGNIFARRFGSVHTSTPSESGRSDRTVRATSSQDQSQAISPSSPQFAPRPTFARVKSTDSHSPNYSVPPSRDGSSSIASQGKTKSSFSSWTARRDSSETARTGHSRQSSVESTNTNSDKKKENKAKKLMKRVSGAFSPRKERSIPSFSEPIMEGAEPDLPSASTSNSGNTYSTRPTTATTTAPRAEASKGPIARPQTRVSNNVVVGEINVQFPDTLLWKRRHVELDGEGNIILAPSALDKSSRVAQKKYHISEFIRPYVPDQEREELPYSIILDFKDSSTLQCACQNAVDQKNVLQALLSFHTTFAKA